MIGSYFNMDCHKTKVIFELITFDDQCWFIFQQNFIEVVIQTIFKIEFEAIIKEILIFKLFPVFDLKRYFLTFSSQENSTLRKDGQNRIHAYVCINILNTCSFFPRSRLYLIIDCELLVRIAYHK